MTKSGTFLDLKLEYNRARDEIERLRAGCNPECPGCGLKPCNEKGQAVLWCDECVGEKQAEIERLRLAYDALRHATLAAHSSHFDRTGGSGTGCLACIDIRAARKNADEVAGYPWLEEK